MSRKSLTYNAAGQFTSIKRYKDIDGGSTHLVAETGYQYDGIGRLTGLAHFKDSTTLADYDWTYDAHSRVTNFAFSHLVGGSGSSFYSYDNTSQITGADHTNQTDENYSYDAAGNRTMSGYSTGTNNRLLSDGILGGGCPAVSPWIAWLALLKDYDDTDKTDLLIIANIFREGEAGATLSGLEFRKMLLGVRIIDE